MNVIDLYWMVTDAILTGGLVITAVIGVLLVVAMWYSIRHHYPMSNHPIETTFLALFTMAALVVWAAVFWPVAAVAIPTVWWLCRRAST